MFNRLFINTRSTIDHVHKQLQLLARIVSLSTQILFIGYYVYLLVINITRVGFLVIYAALLSLSAITLIFDIYFMNNRGKTRLDKRLSIEKKRKATNILLGIRVLLKIAAIVLSGIEIFQFEATQMQLITFTLSIVLLLFYLIFNSLIFIINKDIDLIRLSIDTDIASSKILAKLLNLGRKEYTEQEKELIDEIEKRSEEYLNNEKNY